MSVTAMESVRTYFIMALGCQMNKSDGERLATVLESMGYSRTEVESEADIIAVLACAIRQTAMDRIHGKLRQWQLWRETRPLLTILSGCVLPDDRLKLTPKFDIFFEIKNLDQLPQLIAAKAADFVTVQSAVQYFQVTPRYQSSFQAYVPIMTGCNKFCTYCAVPYTRGREESRPSAEIFQEVRQLLDRGYKEITLIGQNVNSYGHDRPGEMLFPELLHELNSLSGEWWLRFTTSHPYDMTDDLIRVLAERNHLVEWLHLPVQCGNDAVLKRMNRHYTIAHYQERLAAVRTSVPEMAISTDIIVGFCGESDDEFQGTTDLFRTVEYDMAFIAKYSPRPNTLAHKRLADDISSDIKEQRYITLNDILRITAERQNQKLVGQTVQVLVDGFKNGVASGRTRGLKLIKFPSSVDLTGQFVQVMVLSAKPWGLAGSMVSEMEERSQPLEVTTVPGFTQSGS